MYKRQHEDIRPYLDKLMKTVECSIGRMDHSHKVPAKMSLTDGSKVFTALLTVTNSIGQIRVQTLATSTAHEQIKPCLSAMKVTQEKLGMAAPSIMFTDNPAHDKDFLLKMFPTLKAQEKKLAEIATERNKMLNGSPTLTLETPMLGQNRQRVVDSNRIQVLRNTGDINDKVDALREQLSERGLEQTLALDCEWDTELIRESGRRKVGKVCLLQISYRLFDGPDGIHALLIRLPKNGKHSLPSRLHALLTDSSNTFVGVRVKTDIELLGADHGHKDLAAEVKWVDLAMFARTRDVVQRANHSMADLVKCVLNEELDKSEEVRCSRWSSSTLAPRQIQYAALDVIKPLEVYEKLVCLPDLSLRLDPSSGQFGVEVDVVPPHGRNRNGPMTRGFRVADLTTRAAYGRIVDRDVIDCPSGILPKKLKVSEHTCVVEITKVLAPSLVLPHTYKSEGDARRPTLGDCVTSATGDTFLLVLPWTMLKPHVESPTVRTYNEQCQMTPSPHRRVTPPLRAEANETNKADALALELDLLPEVDPDTSDDIASDPDAASDDLASDPDAEMRPELLAAIDRAEESAATCGIGSLLMCSNKLEAPPDKIQDTFSSVLGDSFHAMDRAKVRVKHEYKKPYYVALMRAFFAWDEPRLQEVFKTMTKHGWSEKELESLLFFRPSFFQRLVERIVLPPSQLYWRVRSVFEVFGGKIDSETKTPLFNDNAWAKANNLLQEIRQGLYSDPPGFNFYAVELDSSGKVKTDKYGLSRIRCCRGTNSVENAHRHYVTAFRHPTGYELGDAIISERRHRHNLAAACKHYPDHPKLGHYDTWVVDKLQIYVERNHGVVLHPGWKNICDFRDTEESFVTVALHSEELHIALENHAGTLDRSKLLGELPSDLQFLARAMGVPLPFLPVRGKSECMLFTKIMLNHMDTFDEFAMSLIWIQHVDGKDILPKLPGQLRQHYKKWKRNRAVQDAFRRMRQEKEQLESINKQLVPEDLRCDAVAACLPVDARITYPMAVPPTALAMPSLSAFLPAQQSRGMFVGTEYIGDITDALVLPRLAPKPKQKESKKRKRKTCSTCHEASCPGSGNRILCRLNKG
jgi:hypothetical protein